MSDHDDKADTTERRRHKGEKIVHVFFGIVAASAIYKMNSNGPRTEERHIVHDNLMIACLGSVQTDVYRTGMR